MSTATASMTAVPSYSSYAADRAARQSRRRRAVAVALVPLTLASSAAPLIAILAH